MCTASPRWSVAILSALLCFVPTVITRTSLHEPRCSVDVVGLRHLYLNTLKGSLTGILLETPSYYDANTADKFVPYNHKSRMGGEDWPAYGYTMVGMYRLNNLEKLGTYLLKQNVPGDFFECGVWRGGASIFMRGLLKAYHSRDRAVHLVDSFDGLPKASTQEDHDGWAAMGLLKVPQEVVVRNFQKYGLLDDQVQFHKGFFRNSLPVVRQELKEKSSSISLLRLDGDMYESTMDILFNLAEFLSPGACIVVDDYCIPECNKAVQQFLTMHDLSPNIETIDGCGVFFCLARKVAVDHSWYEHFNANRTE